MKLKINKACDLSSISVLPPHSRRGNAIPVGTDSSVFGKSQGSSQLWSQSQQSFSQGISMSQLSQNSQEDILTNDHRLGSQDNSLKRISCLAPISHTREDSQMPISRSSNNVMRRWSSSTPDHKCHVSEELEHRIGLMETSLNRLGMVLDSVQSDVMQVNRAVKEVSLEMDGIRQKMIVHDNSLQLMLKGEEDIKTSLDVNMKDVSDQLRKESNQHKLDEIESSLLTLPVQFETRLLKLQNELCQTFKKEMGIASIMKPLNEHQLCAVQPPKKKSCIATQFPQKQQPVVQNQVSPLKFYKMKGLIPKTEATNPKSVKPKAVASTDIKHTIKLKQEEVTIMEKEQDWRVIIESDEEIDGSFSFLLEEKNIGMGNNLIEDAREETKRILRKARRRRRKSFNPVILD